MLQVHRALLEKYKGTSVSDAYVCFFRIASYEDKECAQEALLQGNIVFLDLSVMDLLEMQRMKDYMQGICIAKTCTARDICEDYIVYFPKKYHLQIFEN